MRQTASSAVGKYSAILLMIFLVSCKLKLFVLQLTATVLSR
jgi:hypothetical protein